MYPSPPWSSARKVSSTFPSTSTVYAPAVSVQAARTAASSPIRRMTSLVTPRASTAWPPGRSSGARSTTVTSAPRRRSQCASAGPATLAPATNTLLPLTGPPSSTRRGEDADVAGKSSLADHPDLQRGPPGDERPIEGRAAPGRDSGRDELPSPWRGPVGCLLVRVHRCCTCKLRPERPADATTGGDSRADVTTTAFGGRCHQRF